jgi:hypothetical protein
MTSSATDRATHAMRTGPERLVFALAYVGGVGGVSLLLSSAPAWLLALFTLFALASFVAVWRLQFGGRLSYVDPCLLFLFVITVYTVIPLLTFEYFQFSSIGDSRLNHIILDDALIYEVWLCANLAMAGFGGAYLALRDARMPRLEIPQGPLSALWTGLWVSAGVGLAIFVSRERGTYADEYLFLAGLPTIVIQALNIVSAMFYLCAWGLFAYYLTSGRRLFAVGLLAMTLAYFLVISEARSGLVLIVLGFFVIWDHFVRRFSAVTIAALAITGLTIFLVLGLLRGGGYFDINDAAGRSEFMAVFVTALDVQQLHIAGSTLDLNVSMLVSDLFRLIPQQLLDYEKIDPATWYVSNFYPHYAEGGGGLAFGMLSEAILGGGGFNAFLRGLTLGAIVTLAFNFLTRRQSIWHLLIYVWLFVTLYQCFRDTTFTLGGRFLFQSGPALLLVGIMAQLVKARVAQPRAGTGAGAAADRLGGPA